MYTAVELAFCLHRAHGHIVVGAAPENKLDNEKQQLFTLTAKSVRIDVHRKSVDSGLRALL